MPRSVAIQSTCCRSSNSWSTIRPEAMPRKHGARALTCDHPAGRSYPHAALPVAASAVTGCLPASAERASAPRYNAPVPRRAHPDVACRSSSIASTPTPLSRCRASRGGEAVVSRAKTPLLPPSQSVPCASSANAWRWRGAAAWAPASGANVLPSNHAGPAEVMAHRR